MSTLDGFHAAFFTLHRRFPSKQEIFDEGVREGKSRATPADHISQARDAVIVPVELLTDLIDDVRDYAESRSFKDAEVRWRDDLIARARALLPAPPEKPAGDVSDI